MQTAKKERQASEQIIEPTEIQVFIGGFEFLVVDLPATSDVCVPHPLDIMASPLENIELTGHRYLSQRLQRIINNQRCEIHNLRIEVDENKSRIQDLEIVVEHLRMESPAEVKLLCVTSTSAHQMLDIVLLRAISCSSSFRRRATA